MVIVHLKMSGNVVTVQADDLKKDPLCPHLVCLENVVGVTDDSVPGLKVESLTVRSDLIFYYLRGVLEEEEIEPEVEEVEAEIVEEVEEEEEERYIERRERRRGGAPKRKSRARKKDSGYYDPVDEDIYD